MPIYSYLCRICKKVFDEIMRTGDPLPPCPECKSIDVEKQMTSFGDYQIKGNNSGSTKRKLRRDP